jgi:hypothetical protein
MYHKQRMRFRWNRSIVVVLVLFVAVRAGENVGPKYFCRRSRSARHSRLQHTTVPFEQLIFPDKIHDFLVRADWPAAYHAAD